MKLTIMKRIFDLRQKKKHIKPKKNVDNQNQDCFEKRTIKSKFYVEICTIKCNKQSKKNINLMSKYF